MSGGVTGPLRCQRGSADEGKQEIQGTFLSERERDRCFFHKYITLVCVMICTICNGVFPLGFLMCFVTHNWAKHNIETLA